MASLTNRDVTKCKKLNRVICLSAGWSVVLLFLLQLFERCLDVTVQMQSEQYFSVIGWRGYDRVPQ